MLRGERTASEGGGLITGVGNELASEGLRLLWERLALCSANRRICLNNRMLLAHCVQVYYYYGCVAETYLLCIPHTLVSASGTVSCISPFWSEWSG